MNVIKKFEALTLDELLQRKRKLKSIAIILGSFMAIACQTLFYLAFKTRNFALIAVAVSCPWVFIPAFISIAALDKEIKSRSI